VVASPAAVPVAASAPAAPVAAGPAVVPVAPLPVAASSAAVRVRTPIAVAAKPAVPLAGPRPSEKAPVVNSSRLAKPTPSPADKVAPPPGPLVSVGVPVLRSASVTPVRTPVQPAKPAATAAAKPGPTPEAIRTSIQEMAAKLDKSTHFEILGVSANASSDEVGTAFVRAARQFHPDRLTTAGLSDLQPMAERILARINEAAMVLGSPPRRAEYCASLMAGAQTSQNLPTVLEAENAFLRGEVFLKKGDYAHAIESFTAAIKTNPEEPQYQAYLAWARFEDPRARKEAIVRETLKTIVDVVKQRPKFARGYYWVGQLWKFLNEAPKAEAAFREAVQIDESFIEASRELRLIDMRKSKAPAKPENKGRFWKR
jgi:DnaJ-domain-containing protein 1